MNVVWTRTARGHLRAVHDYIAADSPRYARRVVDRLTRKTEKLARLPHLGAEVPEYGDPAVRELFDSPYRILYRVRPDRIDVIGVIHAARQMPADPPDSPGE